MVLLGNSMTFGNHDHCQGDGPHPTNTGRKLEQFEPGQLVRYIPNHAYNNPEHQDCELGRVTSIGKYVFVRFGAAANSEACDPTNLA